MPTFDVVIELRDRDILGIYHDTAQAVDLLLRGYDPRPEVRKRTKEGTVKVIEEAKSASFAEDLKTLAEKEVVPELLENRPLRVYLFAVSKNYVQRAIAQAKVPLKIVNDINQADILLTLKSRYRNKGSKIREAENRGIPVHIVRSNTYNQIYKFVQDLFGYSEISSDNGDSGLIEAERAARRVLKSRRSYRALSSQLISEAPAT